MTEQTKLDLLAIFGYKPEDINCANASTAFAVIFESDHFSEPLTLLDIFITNCDPERFAALKKRFKKPLNEPIF